MARKRNIYDLIILGAGPAGSSLAIRSAQLGLRTLLVDKKPFPREKSCGGILNTRSQGHLRNLQIPLDKLAHPIRKVLIATEHQSLAVEVGSGLVLSRGKLDASLTDRARNVGVHTRFQTLAKSLQRDQKGIILHSLQRSGEECHDEARLVVVAAGIQSGRQFGAKYVAQNSNISCAGVTTHLQDNTASRGILSMYLRSWGYVGAVVAEDGKLIISAAVKLRNRKAARCLIETLVTENNLAEHSAFRSAQWYGTPSFPCRIESPYENRIAFLGDAAFYESPLTGEGIGWALEGASMLAQHLEEIVTADSSNAGDEWAKLYAIRMRGLSRASRIAHRISGHQSLARFALSASATLPFIPRSIGSSLSHQVL